MTDQIVRRYHIHGRVLETGLSRLRNQYEELLTMQMRDDGYVPLFDVVPTLVTNYIPDKDQYEFDLTMQAVYVGEESWSVEGISEGKRIPRNIRPSKSGPS